MTEGMREISHLLHDMTDYYLPNPPFFSNPALFLLWKLAHGFHGQLCFYRQPRKKKSLKSLRWKKEQGKRKKEKGTRRKRKKKLVASLSLRPVLSSSTSESITLPSSIRRAYITLLLSGSAEDGGTRRMRGRALSEKFGGGGSGEEAGF